MTALATNDVNSALVSWTARYAAAGVLVFAFWFVGHALNYSEIIAVETALGPDRAENRFVVQQGETTTSSAIGYFALGGAGVAWWAGRTHRLRWNYGLLLLCAAYVGWCLISLLWSIDAMQTFRKSAIIGLLLMAAFGAAARFELEDFAWIVVIALAVFIGLGALAEAVYGNLRPWRADYRFSGTVHPNDQGLQCAILALAAGLVRFPGADRPWLRRVLVGAAVAALWFTRSRTTLAAFLVAAAVGMVMKAHGVQRWLALTGCLTLLCLGGAAYSFVSVSALDETASVAAMGRRKDVNTLTGRLPLWEELLGAAQERPWLGYGYSTFWNSRNIADYSEMFSWHIPHGHNAYLDITLNIGLVGLVLYLLWFFSGATACAVRYERTGRDGALFGLCLCVFAAVHGITESKFPGAGIGGFALLLVMTMIAVERLAPAPVRLTGVLPNDRRRPVLKPRRQFRRTRGDAVPVS